MPPVPGQRYPEHETGKPCIERGCQEPAGTPWTHLWCSTHDAERLDRISGQFASLLDDMQGEQP